MCLLAVCCTLANFCAFYHLGSLLMRLVLVQVVESTSARFCFAATFALSLMLFVISLFNVAIDSGHFLTLSSFILQGTNRYVFTQATLQVVLALLLVLVLLMCPWLMIESVLQGLVNQHKKGRARRLWGFMSSPNVTSSTLASRRRCSACVRVLLRAACLVGILFLLFSSLHPDLVVAQAAGDGGEDQRQNGRATATAGSVKGVGARRALGNLRGVLLHMPKELQVEGNAQQQRQQQKVALEGDATEANIAPSTDGEKIRHTEDDAAAVLAASEGGVQEGTPLEAQAIVADDRNTGHGTMTFVKYVLCSVTARVAVVGVACMGLLSGYAAVTTPFTYLVSYFYWRGKTDHLLKAQEALCHKQRYVLDLCSSKRKKLAMSNYDTVRRQQQQYHQQSYADSHKHRQQGNGEGGRDARRGRGLFGWMRSATGTALSSIGSTISSGAGALVGGSGGGGSSAQLHADCEATRYLSLSLYLEMDEVDRLVYEARRGDSLVGKLYAVLGVLFGMYSLGKTVATIASLALWRYSEEDPITRAVNFLENTLVLRRRDSGGGGYLSASSPEYSMTAIQISTQVIFSLVLIMNAWMVVSSMRGLLITIYNITLSLGGVITAETTALGLSTIMGIYFIGQIVTMRQSLPSPDPHKPFYEQHALRAVLGQLPTYYYQRLNDWCYLAGCVFSMFGNWLALTDPAQAGVSERA